MQSLARRPLDKVELAKELGLPVDDRNGLRLKLREMEQAGKIARIRKDRYIIPKEADLFTGIIQFHPSGYAWLVGEEPGQGELWISAENTWTAMHGDRVVARLITVDRDKAPRRPANASKQEGRVIRILHRANATIVGTLQKSKNFYYVVADDPRFVHNLYVQPPKPPNKAQPGDKVVAKLEEWTSRHVNPEGEICEVLGPAGAPGVDMLSIVRKHRLPLSFPEKVLHEAESIAPEVESAEAARREDLRGRMILTVDPDDARDFDDAIEVERTKDGWKAAVHIADVSHYVQPKTALDKEAVARGNSTYLADRVIPMLPEALSNGICSLKPGVDRLAFSVFAEITRKGRIHRVRFAKTVIRSAARLTYREALQRLESKPTDAISEKLHLAWELSSHLRKWRFERGSLDLDFPEVKVWLDAEGKAVRMERMENDISHQMIEELMLFANECVARELKLARQPTIYRVHETPDPDRLEDLRETVHTYGLKVGDLSTRGEIQKMLKASRGQSFEYALKIALLKSLKRARYTHEPLGHYGLAKPDYLHFTSPIRRYADLVTHRALEKHLGLTKRGPSAQDLSALSEHISGTERASAEAEKESVKLKKLEYFQRQLQSRRGDVFKARIIEIRNFGMFVELPDFLLTGLVHISAIDGDFFVHDPARNRLVGRKTKKIFQAGDALSVVVARVDIFKQQVDFKPV